MKSRSSIQKSNAEKVKAWRTKYPDRYAKSVAVWKAKNPGYAASVYIRHQEEKAGRKKPKRCDVCKRSGRRICFDHCHKKKHFRGWLCWSCNYMLGHAEDSAKLLRKLADYLDADRARQKELKDARRKK